MAEQELVDRADGDDELVDRVDEHGEVIDVVTRAEMRRRRLRHRCVFVIVTNSSGEVLVQRRSLDKDLWPDRWDIGAGGVVSAGESWDSAARRELGEELGIHGPIPAFVAAASYDDDEVSEVGRIYRVTWDGTVEFADGEVVEARWVTRPELDEMMATEPFVPDVIAVVVPHLRFPA